MIFSNRIGSYEMKPQNIEFISQIYELEWNEQVVF